MECEPNHVGRSGSPWALGESFTYLDLSPFQVMEGLRYTLPRTMAARVPRLRRLTKLAHRVRRRPGIAAYLDSPRRLPIQHRGSLPALPRARGTHPRDPDGPRAPREPSPSWRIGSHASRPARRGGETPRGRGADGHEGARDGFRRVQRGDRTFCSRSDGGGDPLLHTIHRSAPGEPPGRARSDARPGARPVIRSQPIRVLAWMGQP